MLPPGGHTVVNFMKCLITGNIVLDIYIFFTSKIPFYTDHWWFSMTVISKHKQNFIMFLESVMLWKLPSWTTWITFFPLLQFGIIPPRGPHHLTVKD